MKTTKLLYFTRVAYTHEGKPRKTFVFFVATDDDDAAREIERRLPVIVPLIEKIEYEPPVLCPGGHHTVAWAADKIDNFGSALATTLELSDNNKKSMSIEEARELAALTDRIVANLKTIDKSGISPDGQRREMSEEKKVPTTEISLKWDISDVKCRRPQLTKEQCGEVLDAVMDHHDASVGVNWDNLDFWADELFPMDEDTGTIVDAFIGSFDDYGGDWDTIQKEWDEFQQTE
jgi:hypothetical protein